MGDKSPLKWAWSRSRDLFNVWGPDDISGTAKARVIRFYTRVDYIKALHMDDRPP